MYQITDEERSTAMATSRNRGAVGANALVPRVVRDWINPGDETILDFGCGKDAAHVLQLRSEDYRAFGYDFHLVGSSYLLERTYDLVYASNVLNVQDSDLMLRETLRQMWACVRPGGLLIVNLPGSPRKGAYEGLTPIEGCRLLYSLMSDLPDHLYMAYPDKVGGTSTAPVFKLQKDY